MDPQFIRILSRIAIGLLLIALIGCGRPEYDASTPDAAMDSAQMMVEDGNADLLVTLIHIEPRDISFEDGVTEASAISDVKSKLAELLGRLWTVGTLLQEQCPDEVLDETDFALGEADDATDEEFDFGGFAGDILADPFAFIEDNRDRIEVLDLGDGTAAVLLDDEPAFGGFLAMEETDEGWKFSVPTELVRGSEYWPQTRWEWAVIASMMLGIENSLQDFEDEVRARKFKSLSKAAERAGRFIGESVVVQGVIYAYMKRGTDDDDEESEDN